MNNVCCNSSLSIVHYSLYTIFALSKTVIVAQSVRAPDCGSGGRGFEPRLSPFTKALIRRGFFYDAPVNFTHTQAVSSSCLPAFP